MTETMTRADGPTSGDPKRGNPLVALAEFAAGIRSDDIPPEVSAAAVRGVVDLVGVMVAGAVQPDMTPLVEHVAGTYSRGRATALGIAEPMTAEAAAYVNSAAGHVLDFDDCNDALGGHPSVVTLPAALALAEETGVSSSETLASYVVGVEVAGALGRSLNMTHYERGWHPTATIGIFGAAAAAARLLGADVETTARAFAIAASMSSGIKGNFGTFMKPGQVGFATAKGVAAARLAVAGATANNDVFRGAQSFPSVFNGAPVDWSSLEGLGRTWSIVSPGLVFKLYPCCGSTHAPIDAALELYERGEIDPPTVSEIDIAVHPRRQPHTNRPSPTDGLQGKFSVQYVTARAATRGAVTVADFDDDQVRDPVIASLLEHVHLGDLAPEAQTIIPGRLDCFAAQVTIVDANGAHMATVDAPKGSDPARPVSDADLDSKFISTAGIGLGQDAARSTLERLRAWCEGRGQLGDLMARIRTGIRR